LFNEKNIAEIWQYFVNILCSIFLCSNLAGFRNYLEEHTTHSHGRNFVKCGGQLGVKPT